MDERGHGDVKIKLAPGLPIKTSLEFGDAYVDRPVFKDAPVYCAKEPLKVKRLDHYRREPLRWMKPVGGKLVPR